MIEGYFAGFAILCTKCKSDKIVIFFVDGFQGKLRGEWKEKIRARKTKLSDKCDIIAKFTPKSKTVGSTINPNWICKNCYTGGVVISNE